MSDSYNTLSHENDDRFRKPGIIAPLIIFIATFISSYGFIIVVLLNLASWFIHAYSIDYFLSKGNFGIIFMAIVILLCWSIFSVIIAAIIYFILKLFNQPVLAQKIPPIILFILFLNFTLPWVLWPTIRRNSPTLSKKYRQKLKKMAKGPIMKQRLAQRRALLKNHVN